MELEVLCYTCLQKINGEAINLDKSTEGDITLKEMLSTCIANKLEESKYTEICLSCFQLLKMTYQFLSMVKSSQESLILYKFYKSDVSTDTTLSDELNNLKTDLDSNNDSTVNDIPCAKLFQTNLEQTEHSNTVCDFDDKILKQESDDTKANNDGDKIIYSCEICHESFDRKWKLQKHLKRTHVNDKPFVCTYCGKTFKLSHYLKEHLTVHTGLKKYLCNICGKKFQRSSSQRRHMRVHERPPGEKEKKTPFLCPICGKEFPYANGKQRHMRIHSGIRKYECDICKKRFRQSTHLLVHMRTHTGEKPYICDACGKAFSLNATLQKHIKTHKDEINEFEIENKIDVGESAVFIHCKDVF